MIKYLGNSTRPILRDLATQIRAKTKIPLPKGNAFEIVWGVVQGVFAGPPRYVTLQLMGDKTGTGTVTAKCASGYHPQTDDYVFGFYHGKDLIIVGSLGGTMSGIQIPFAYAILGPLPVSDLPGVHVPVPTGQSVKVVGAYGSMSSGSVTLDLKDSGTTITGLGGITVTTTPTSFPCTAHAVSADNKLHGTPSSVTGTGDMSLSFYTEIIG